MLASPQVYRERKFSFQMYFNDHPPPHIHVVRGTGHGAAVAKLWLRPVAICAAKGFNESELRWIHKMLKLRNDFFMEEWNAVQAKAKTRL